MKPAATSKRVALAPVLALCGGPSFLAAQRANRVAIKPFSIRVTDQVSPIYTRTSTHLPPGDGSTCRPRARCSRRRSASRRANGVEGAYNLTRWTEMPRGGHFAALEEPQLLAEDIRAFFRTLR